MNIKPLLLLSCFIAVTLIATSVMAGPQRGGGNHFAGMAARGGGMARSFVGGNRMMAWNGRPWNNWNGQHWNGAHWKNWNWHHHDHDPDVFFVSRFGFPVWGWAVWPWSSN